jgi:benzylsuccinate CoA-transferase BbsF subunit
LLDFAANGRIEARMGNEDPLMAPHGCYPCRGDDRWIAIAVSTDAQWRALAKVLGQPAWLEDTRFRDGLGRWRHRVVLDQPIAEATRTWDAHQLMQELQGAGVAAGAVLDSKALLFDPHLLARRFYEVVGHHPSTGMPPLPYASRPWKLGETPPKAGQAAPIMGEHNKVVLSQLLGHTEEELTILEGHGVIGYAPTNPRPVRRPSPEEQVRQGRMHRYEQDYREQVAREYGAEPPPEG